ncbi:glycosyltransferase 87 family protein [Glaciibacter sp. 2TAF33]|uniref:glycosyltransferase 87 family protein n=1 Tax=Glaciibacter sp. 2TAF33 TaxID=3233015 RepID=UPI003F9104A1
MHFPPALRSRTAGLWGAFLFVHAVLIVLCRFAPGWPLGDIDRVYLGWARAAASGGPIVGISTEFVYPILAFVPIFLAIAFGPAPYALTWLGIVTVLNGVAFAVLIRPAPGAAGPGRWRRRAAWWWLAFLLLLGPIALARIDSVTVPLVIIALLWLRTRPLWATVLLTVATWVKVWPAAVIAALLVSSTRRWRVLAAAAGTSALIIAAALSLGSGGNVFSFVGQQTARGIQIESPVGLVWMWQVAFKVPGAMIYYDREILTFQVTGAGIDVAIALMTPLLALAAASVLVIGALAARRGARFEYLFPPLVLALTVTLIAFNKVGSPQFLGWLAAPVILGLVVNGRAWRTPALIVAALAALTQVVYPYLYDWLLVANPVMVLMLSARNLLEFVLLGWGVWRVAAAGSRRAGLPGIPAHALQKE